MTGSLTELIARAPWREAVTHQSTWPHQYVLSVKDGQQQLLAAVCERLRAGEGVICRFFVTSKAYLFVGEYKYWLMSDLMTTDPWRDNVNYVLNRARLYRDLRDFVIQPGDTGRREDYPMNPPKGSGTRKGRGLILRTQRIRGSGAEPPRNGIAKAALAGRDNHERVGVSRVLDDAGGS